MHPTTDLPKIATEILLECPLLATCRKDYAKVRDVRERIYRLAVAVWKRHEKSTAYGKIVFLSVFASKKRLVVLTGASRKR